MQLDMLTRATLLLQWFAWNPTMTNLASSLCAAKQAFRCICHDDFVQQPSELIEVQVNFVAIIKHASLSQHKKNHNIPTKVFTYLTALLRAPCQGEVGVWLG